MRGRAKRVILDTDPGIDDALAILLALASPEIALEGITVVHGNCSVEQGAINALSVLELGAAASVPVYEGFARPLVQQSLPAPETHGSGGLGHAELRRPKGRPSSGHAMKFLIEAIMASPGEMTLVAIGPLTNLAMAVRREPRLVDAVEDVIIMGGAIRHAGNVTPLAEYNTYVDPHAAHIVYHSGLPITLVPLDVTYQCILTTDDVQRLLRVDSPITRFIADATRFYIEYHREYQGIGGCIINDPLAVALTFAPDLVDVEEHYVDVDVSGGVSMGKTFADFFRVLQKPPNVGVALGVRARDFVELFLERMEALAR